MGNLERWYTSHHPRGEQRNLNLLIKLSGDQKPKIEQIYQSAIEIINQNHSLLCKLVPPSINGNEETFFQLLPFPPHSFHLLNENSPSPSPWLVLFLFLFIIFISSVKLKLIISFIIIIIIIISYLDLIII